MKRKIPILKNTYEQVYHDAGPHHAVPLLIMSSEAGTEVFFSPKLNQLQLLAALDIAIINMTAYREKMGQQDITGEVWSAANSDRAS
ncbi:hypothetical protein [Nissabacter sp. SGAir0207]|uniref:hypothetical protein n=1 Tax=Nissabacter sp. SGAir0207 TaxID=2126321 RepID=UPI0010CD3AF9|nr:hypothetical protein [Nissabacter sp. SGAir0207]QCR38374.1 hypothetical protein C1N62_19735 [Nissabacter sp. SGAir0207]